MGHYLFNVTSSDGAGGRSLREQAAARLAVGMWGVDPDALHRDELAPGDLVVIYVGAPDRQFIGRAKLATKVRHWAASEAQVYPGDSTSGVVFAEVAPWDHPVPMETVLAQLRAAGETKARADFEHPLVRITAFEYDTVLAVSAGSSRGTPS